MTPLVVDALDRQSDWSSASNGVARTKKRRVEYKDCILFFWLFLRGLRVLLVLLKAVAG